jgi:predicted DNA-binding protein
MATIEQRVNIALDGSTLEIVKRMAKNAKLSISKICADLIRKRIEDDEDAYYAKLINEMGDIDSKSKISSEEMRRRLDALQD